MNSKMHKWLGLIAGIVIAVQVTPAIAQQGREQSRQDRIREHQERIKKILEESNRRRAEQQQQEGGQAPPQAPGTAAGTPAAGATPAGATPAPGAAAGTGQAAPPAAARPGQALPTGPVQNARMTPPVTQGSPTPAAQEPQTARSESRTILMFHPMDSIVAVGDRFKTSVMAETKEGEIDEISFLMKYPRHILNPLGLNHGALDPFVKGSIEYEFNPDDGTIYLHAKLKKPTRFSQKEVVSVVWEAIEPTEGAVISYQFGEGQTTGLYLKGTSLLGTMPDSNDGVINATVQVIGPRTKPTVTKLDDGILIGGKPPRGIDDRPAEDITLDLKPTASALRAGETFDIGVVLQNPGEERIDRLRLYLQFDPAEMEVVDTDLGNVVTRGVNIRDAEAREEFPFDYYRYNYADNEKGLIVYEVSSSNSQVRGSGRVATIRMRALKESPRTELVLVRNGEGLTPTTDVSFLGESKLEIAASEQAQPIEGVAIRVSGKAVAGSATEPLEEVYNPFVSNLARRMRNQAD